jgi:hypothetical protein
VEELANEPTSASATTRHAKEQTRSVKQRHLNQAGIKVALKMPMRQELYSQIAKWKKPECDLRRPPVAEAEALDFKTRYGKIDLINTVVDGMTPGEEDDDRLGCVPFRPKAPYKDRKDMMRSRSPRWRRLSPYDPRRTIMRLDPPGRMVPHETRELPDRRGRSVSLGIKPAGLDALYDNKHTASGDLTEQHSKDSTQDISDENISDETSDVSAQKIVYYRDRYEGMGKASNREFHQTVLMKRHADAAEKERDDYKKKVVELEAKVIFLE